MNFIIRERSEIAIRVQLDESADIVTARIERVGIKSSIEDIRNQEIRCVICYSTQDMREKHYSYICNNCEKYAQSVKGKFLRLKT